TGYTEIISQITSIDEFIFNNEELSYNLYPNPVSDNLTLKLGKILEYDLNMSLYNNIGVMVKQLKLSKGMIGVDINMGDLPLGIYYLQLRTNDNYISSSKIIKSN
ncbi:MAG: T9SS type A sorting domain-containing protein, partial [Bacteroidales bacterium]|nr:T9SS type A sorting domain-containing protein [Bacteroidales bacterium]